ncbi:hypothetical protein [Halosolutus gelatinilyticus]|uniref:hypothetical protein n=1 Tax=Halosolutus gelatinilyticus TaxID=2931975 RepID=UPI001FF0EF58|nr:hypothetical protein [Halosolutus gelatinilyticus]
MERRKLLLGSGAALATVLAGCSSSDTGDDDPNNADDGSNSDADGTDSGQNGDDGSDGDSNDGTDSNKGADFDDVPGFDSGDLSMKSDLVSVDSVKRDGDEVHVTATTKTTDTEKLRNELDSLGHDMDKVTYDLDRFKAEIKVVRFSVVDTDGNHVVSFSVYTKWIVKYANGQLTDDEFYDLVQATAK